MDLRLLLAVRKLREHQQTMNKYMRTVVHLLCLSLFVGVVYHRSIQDAKFDWSTAQLRKDLAHRREQLTRERSERLEVLLLAGKLTDDSSFKLAAGSHELATIEEALAEVEVERVDRRIWWLTFGRAFKFYPMNR